MKKVSFEKTKRVVSGKYPYFIKNLYSREISAIIQILMGLAIH